ncbi:MAG: M14 family metallopeptidase [Burkholderiaceae bacterium]
MNAPSISARYFSRNYAEARNKFRDAALAADAALTSILHPSKGVAGETVAMDIATLGNPAAANALLTISGTHGIEGYCGSGAQIALFENAALLRDVAAGKLRLIQLHALNPHGFSFGRRVNEDNIDLNRNFIDFAQPLPVNPGYAQLHAHLLPGQWPPAETDEQVLQAYSATHGAMGLQQAISGGQYIYTDGLFYGGRAAAWSNTQLRSLLAQIRQQSPHLQRFFWIDFHTGLGPAGHGERIYACGPSAASLAYNRSVWGAQMTSFLDGSSTSAPLVGVNSQAAMDVFSDIKLACIALEYGTVPMERVMFALRADHWLAKQHNPPAELVQATRAAMRAAFYVETDQWKEDIVRQAHEAVADVLQAAS